jgi:hypothetical protein
MMMSSDRTRLAEDRSSISDLAHTEPRRGITAVDRLQHGAQIAEKSFRILAHWKMAETLHDRHVSAGIVIGNPKRLFRHARIVVFARQQENNGQRLVSISARRPRIAPLDPVEIKIGGTGAASIGLMRAFRRRVARSRTIAL